MNKRNNLGVAICTVNGYTIRTIVDSNRKDTGKIAIYAGKLKVSDEKVNNKSNVDSMKSYIISHHKQVIRKGIKIDTMKSLSTGKTRAICHISKDNVRSFPSLEQAYKFIEAL